MVNLPTRLDPLDRVWIELLAKLEADWRLPLNELTDTEEKALSRMKEAGLTEERLILTAAPRDLSTRARMRCRVNGPPDDLCWKRLYEFVPEWLTPDGKIRTHHQRTTDVSGIRLTVHGERAKQAILAGQVEIVLGFLRGEGMAAGQCVVEKFWMENESQPAVMTVNNDGLRTPDSTTNTVISSNDPRDHWIYQQAMEGVAWKTIRQRLAQQDDTWERQLTDRAVRDAAIRYSKRKQLPAPPKRKAGRHLKIIRSCLTAINFDSLQFSLLRSSLFLRVD